VAEEHGLAFPVLEGSGEVLASYRVPGTPYFYVIGEDGVILNAGFASTQEQLEALVKGGESME